MAGRKKVAQAPSTTTQDGPTQIIKELWQTAVNLRGSIEPADYKRYVLPIIFLRFLSLGYERRREELITLIADPSSDLYQEDASEDYIASVLEDEDEYRQARVFVVPLEARWGELRKNAQADDIKLRLDNALDAVEKAYPEKLRGLLPRIFVTSNLDRENVTGLINLFSKDIFRQDHGGSDLIGQVYEYFIGEFASSEGKRGGEYFTPQSIVETLVAMLEPTSGTVYDPCCGSGGMFVQSDNFTHHEGNLSFFGQESKDFTYRLCRLNLFIHGADGDIKLGNSYFNDQHATLRADYIIANPPFNDGSKSEDGWGASRLTGDDPRLKLPGETASQPLAAKNANTMWMLHFLHHLKPGGTAGFVMATGELSSGETNRLAVRQALVEGNHVDCVLQLSGQLFANTQIPCCLWFLSKNRNGENDFRQRTGEILFIDARKLGVLIPGSRKQKFLSDEEIEQIASVYRQFKRESAPDEVPGFCRVATLGEVKGHSYALTPGRYVGAEDVIDDGEPFEERMPKLLAELNAQFARSRVLETTIQEKLASLGLEPAEDQAEALAV